tara:strand:- start:202 stop:516 length:315 start_codon:yes stop_codon:yes gene_type:complete
MKKFSIIFLIFLLILFTALIKNSTKRIEDEIFFTEETIRTLKKDFENIKLEYDYLSSAEKLLSFQNLYFDKDLEKKDVNEINIIKKKQGKLVVEKLEFIKRNEK